MKRRRNLLIAAAVVLASLWTLVRAATAAGGEPHLCGAPSFPPEPEDAP